MFLVVGVWGAFFGAAAVALAAALLAFTRSARRVAMSGSVSALLSAAYVLVFLGWVPGLARDELERVQAITAIASAAVMAFLLFLLVGAFRRAESLRRTRLSIAAMAAVAVTLAWFVPAVDALLVGIGVTIVMSLAAMAAAIASAVRGERTGRISLVAIVCMIVSMLGLDWYAFHPQSTPWQLHALSAVAGIAYLLCIATAIGMRYAYLIEVSQVMTQGPDFDPVTRLPAYEAGRPAGDIFPGSDARPCGLIAISIANLKLLEELHGRGAYNHALFVCASRLRRLSLPGTELGRLREDGFVLLVRHVREVQPLIDHARAVLRRLARPVVLGTSRDIAHLETSRAEWQAGLGIGVLVEHSTVQLEIAIAGARAMSRTAWSFASRIAWYDEASGAIAELPAGD